MQAWWVKLSMYDLIINTILNDPESPSRSFTHYRCDFFSYSCEAVDSMSTNRVSCITSATTAVSLLPETRDAKVVGSRPSDHYFRSVCWFVCLFVQSFFSAVFDPIWITLGDMLYVWV